MDRSVFKEMVEGIVKAREGDWVGVHDCHQSNGLAEIIESSGLCVSHNPYGKQGRGLPLENNFRTNMFGLSEDGRIDDMLFMGTVICPVFVIVPRELLELFKVKPTDFDSFKHFCVPGKMEHPEPDSPFRKVTLTNDMADANVNVVPPYLIAGHIDMEAGVFVKNPRFFENLSQKEKQEIIATLRQSAPSQFGE